MVITFLASAALFLLLRLWIVFKRIHRHRRNGKVDDRNIGGDRSCRTLIVLGSGGHTSELLSMTKHLESSFYHPIIYCKAATDTTSVDRLRNLHGPGRTVYDLPRAREVGQSYVTSVYTTIYAFGIALYQVWFQWKPELVLCNGPGTCIPICAAVVLGNILGLQSCRIVFVESFCRVESLSLTGRLLYMWADVFVVHWVQLQQRYPNTIVTTAIVPDQERVVKSKHT